MAQIREGCFRVIAVNQEDLDLVDLHGGKGHFVSVELHHEAYPGGFQSQLANLVPGNCITSTIQSEDVYRPDGVWRFLSFNCFEETELHAIEVKNIPIQDLVLMDGAFENGQSKPEPVSENGNKIGFKIGLPDSRGAAASGPVIATYKEMYKVFRGFADPPYEIISLTQQGIPLEVRYYLSKKGSEVASRLLSHGTYLGGQDR